MKLRKDLSPISVLLPIDFSDESMRAYDTAIAFCEQQHATLALLHVTRVPIIVPNTGETKVGAVAEVGLLAANKLKDLSKTASARLGQDVDFAVEIGIPAPIICSYAALRKFDLIILTTKKRFALAGLFRESTTNKIVKNAHCPVLTLPASRKFSTFKTILMPVRSGGNALKNYHILRGLFMTDYSILHVAGLTRVADVEDYDHVNESIEVLRRKLQLDQVPYSARIHFCESLPDQLLKISSSETPDLIVITARIEQWFKKLFLEYYTKIIVNRAPCPVLSIRSDITQAN
jgi:nucleotide-binding universal stress UspA family protein